MSRTNLEKTISTSHQRSQMTRDSIGLTISDATRNADRITLSWKDINISAVPRTNCFDCLRRTKRSNEAEKQKSKMILEDVSGYCKPGELLAIMGASGAGKSTLLNALTYRNMNMTGLRIESRNIYANGVSVSKNSLTSLSAYIQQDDLFLGRLTVKEHLIFQARLRMDKDVSHKERLATVDKVIHELGLSECSKTRIGAPGNTKGISGGEMKRLSFATEILTNPPLMFCDEPTSGLDSYMSESVVGVLRELARKGKTIVFTIHQPSSQVFAMFDRILFLAEGRVAYLGDVAKTKDFFTNNGYPFPEYYNPADHYISVLAVTPGQETDCRKRISEICDNFKESDIGKDMLNTVEQEIRNPRNHSLLHYRRQFDCDTSAQKTSLYKANWINQLGTLLWRSWLTTIREPMLIQLRFSQTVAISLALGIVFLRTESGYDINSVQDINGALFLILLSQSFFNLFPVVNVFCQELPIFLREHFNGMYRLDVYFISKQIVELPFVVSTSLIFVTIFYWMAGLNPAFDRFLVCCLIDICVVLLVQGFGYLISCIAPTLDFALMLAPGSLVPQVLFAGFFLHLNSIKWWLSWMKYTSWFYYGNELLVINQWKDVQIQNWNCTYKIENSNCDGNSVIEIAGFHKDNFYPDVACLVAMAVFYRILGLLFLMLKAYRK